MRVREPFFSKVRNPIPDLLARILAEEPAEFGAVAVLQGAFDHKRRSSLRVELREIVFLKEGRKRGWDWHVLI